MSGSVSHQTPDCPWLQAECLSVGADEHSVPVIKLMEADLQV